MINRKFSRRDTQSDGEAVDVIHSIDIPIVLEFARFLTKKSCYNKTIEYIFRFYRECTISSAHDVFSNAIGIHLMKNSQNRL